MRKQPLKELALNQRVDAPEGGARRLGWEEGTISIELFRSL